MPVLWLEMGIWEALVCKQYLKATGRDTLKGEEIGTVPQKTPAPHSQNEENQLTEETKKAQNQGWG